MAHRTTDRVIPDLGERIAFLEGILGYRRDLSEFRDEKLGDVVSAGREHFGRMRRGKCAISVGQLSRLVDFFELGPDLDYRVFLVPLNDFERNLREKRVGTFGGPPLGTACTALLAFAKRPDGPRIGMSLRRVGAVRRGGLGPPNESIDPATGFFLDEKADIEIKPTAAGHLVLLTHHLDVDLTCLMPSVMAPETKIAARTLTIPTSPAYEYLRVRGPCGRHRLFAVWTEREVKLPWLGRERDGDRMDAVSGAHAGEFVKTLSKLKVGSLAVAFRDYVVQERRG